MNASTSTPKKLHGILRSVVNSEAHAIAMRQGSGIRADLEAWAWELIYQGKSFGEVIDLIREEGEHHVRGIGKVVEQRGREAELSRASA